MTFDNSLKYYLSMAIALILFLAVISSIKAQDTPGKLNSNHLKYLRL